VTEPYECHLTLDPEHEDLARHVGAARGWGFSRIDGDPLLGDRVLCCLTRHSSDFRALALEMKAATADVRQAGGDVLRQKIERTMFDTGREGVS
jgi:hypothetical protein